MTYYYNHHKNKKLYKIFDDNAYVFSRLAHSFSNIYSIYNEIPTLADYASDVYFYSNKCFPPLDAMGIGIILNYFKDIKSIIEVGSGNTTKLFKFLKDKLDLKFKLTCIDPAPRANILNSTDNHIQKILQQVDIDSLIEEINSQKTLLFIDSSHRMEINSDCTVIFTEILGNLSKGTIVHFHDIFLPDDYPDSWYPITYNEQYPLATYLTNSNKYNLLWSSWYINKYLNIEVINRFHRERPDLVQRDGGSLWLEINQ
jgi:hypothetical protein